MKKLFILTTLLLSTLAMSGQKDEHPKFDPAKFDAELEQFITTNAALSPQEAAQFFPLYREMQRKQRVCFDEMRRYRHVDVSDDKVCREIIEKKDKMDVEIKEIQQQYHQKFLKVLPASKVLQIVRAEERFHRQVMRRTAQPGGRRPEGGKRDGHRRPIPPKSDTK